MNDTQTKALARLRAADPAAVAAGGSPDAASPYARAVLERVLAAGDAPVRPRTRPVGRLVAAGAVGAAAAVVASVLAVTTPWTHGQAAAAYTVDKLPNGSLHVTIRLAQLQDPARLNAELRRENAHTVALRMLPGNQCLIGPSIAHQFAEPDPNRAEQAVLGRTISWVDRAGTTRLVIDPRQIPADHTLVVAFATYHLAHGGAERVIPRIVPSVPRCLPALPAPQLPAGHTVHR